MQGPGEDTPFNLKCEACLLCEKICPPRAITIEARPTLRFRRRPYFSETSVAGYYTPRVSEYAVNYPNRPFSPPVLTPVNLDLEEPVDLTKADDVLDRASLEAWDLTEMLNELMRAQVIEEVRAAGRRGRGGAGVLTAEKLSLAARAAEEPKYLICNAYDADARSLISKTLLAKNPHLVIEGMALAAFACGASEGFLYMRSGDAALVETVRGALREAQERGVLGHGMFGSQFQFAITLTGVQIGFLGGKESTLIQVIKGRPAKAQQRPPYPTDFGLFDRPTIVQNVETLCNLPLIISRGGEAYRRTGTTTSPGTKLFTVLGPGLPPGGTLVEVPFGTSVPETLREAGAAANESVARAVVIGGM